MNSSVRKLLHLLASLGLTFGTVALICWLDEQPLLIALIVMPFAPIVYCELEDEY